VAAIRRRAFTGGAMARPGNHSVAVYQSRYRRWPTRCSPPMAACLPASPTVSSGPVPTRGDSWSPVRITGGTLDALLALGSAMH